MARVSTLRFPAQSYRYADGRRPMFGRSSGSSGFKARLIIALVIAAFAFLSYYGKSRDVNEVTGEPERVALTDEADEVMLGMQARPELVNMHGGPSLDVAAQQRVNTIGWRLLDGLNRDLQEFNRANPGANRRNPYEETFQFTLLRDPKTVNAFALPGGQVFITEALYRQLETEGQLAGVLGHEIGHVLDRHGNKQMARQGLFQGLAGAVGVLGGSQQSAQMAEMVSATVAMKYGREAELESDDWGVKLTYWAGYDPRAMIGVMKVLEAASGGQAPPEFFSTHPKPANRVAYIEEAIKRNFPDGIPAGLRP